MPGGAARVNEAYSRALQARLRRDYDLEFFSTEIAEDARQRRAIERRRTIASSILIGALGLVVVAQAIALVYIGVGEGAGLFTALIP